MLYSLRFNSLFYVAATIALCITAASCNSNNAPQQASIADTAKATAVSADSTTTDTSGNTDYALLCFVIADTGKSYYTLMAEMYALAKATGLTIDTMDRYYNKDKNLIAVPDNDEDEMYRGEYYPRRFPAVAISLEYYKTYIPYSSEKNIALVAGIFDNGRSADSLLSIIKPASKKAFTVKANVFEGCMH